MVGMEQVSPAKRKHSPLSESPPAKQQDSLSESPLTSVKRRRADSKEERSEGEQRSLTTRGHTYRVRGVPLDWDVQGLKSFLADRCDSAGPSVGSLAEEINGRSHTATITFQGVPRQAKRPWYISLPAASNQSADSQSLTLDDEFLGITTLHTPPSQYHKVDVVAISGLGGHAFGSFKEKGGEHMWVRDALPRDLNPLARVMVYGYKSSLPDSESFQNLEDLGTRFRDHLRRLLSAGTFKPIIFIAHSLGGLIVKQTLISLSKSNNEDDSKLLRAVYGIVFFGVPHDGMDIESLIPMVEDRPNRFLLESIGSFNSQILTIQRREFPKAFAREGRSEIFCFYETVKSPTAVWDKKGKWQMTGKPAYLVTKSSATHCRPWENGEEHICAIDRTHSELVKFGYEDDEYDMVLKRIQGLVRRAPAARSQTRRSNIEDGQDVLEQNPEARECLSVLYVTDPLKDKKALKHKKGDRAQDTCEWILGTEELMAWLGPGRTGLSENQASNVLWLYGNPGTGKSTLAIFLTDELSTRFSPPDGDTLAYFFCDSAFDTRKTATSVIRGLLLQLVQERPQLLSYVLPQYNKQKKELFESFDDLWTIFMNAAVDEDTGRKYCIIDALDECDPESQKTLLQYIQETFQSQDAPSNIRILVTSRPYPEIREYLEEFVHRDLASFPDAKQDVDRCIEEKVAELAKKKRYSEKIKGQVRDSLRDKAEGTFLWVGIACNELKGIASKDAVSRLQAMPRGLHSLYKNLFTAALERETDRDADKDVDKGAIRRILSVVAVSRRPLNLLELSEVCQLAQNEDDIETRTQFMRDYIESCRLMVVIQDEKVLLLHQSVKDYLLKASETTGFSELEAHANLAYRGVSHLIEQFHAEKQTHSHFSKYASQEWPNHARMAQSRFEVRATEEEFFRVDSPCRESWLTSYRQFKGIFSRTPERFSILHVAARWGVPAIAKHVSRSCDQHDEEELIHTVDASGETPLECAATSGYQGVVCVLLDLGAVVSRKVTLIAAANSRNGKEVMALLLERLGGEMTITDEVVKAAAGNWGNGKEVIALLLERPEVKIKITDEAVTTIAKSFNAKVMALLLKRRGSEMTITDEVVKAAAGNYGNGKEVMALLLERLGGEMTITNEVVKAAAGNGGNGKEVMALLLERRGSEMTITDEVVKAAAGNGKQVIALLLERRGGEMTITDEVVKAAAGNWGNGKEVMALLLEQRRGEITITDEAVTVIARNFDEKVMALLLKWRGGKITITDEAVTLIARNFDEKVLALLLERQGGKMTVTDDVVKAVVGNSGNGKEVMALLLEQRRGEITITDEAVTVIARNFDEKVMALLLKRQGSKMTITDEVVKAAAANWRNGKEVIALLLEWRGGEMTGET